MRFLKNPFFIFFSIGFLFLTLISVHKFSSHYQKKQSKTIQINITSQPTSLDPRKARSLNDLNVIRMVMEGLTRMDYTNLPTLSLAEKFTVSEDKKTYTFSLREALWTNGEKIVPADFIHAWTTSLSPCFPSDNANSLYVIKNAEKIKKGFLDIADLGVSSPNEKTLIVELEKPTPYFLELLSSPIFFPIHKKTDIIDPKWAESPLTYVSSGPFMIDEWKHHNILSVKKNPRYWESEQVRLDKVDMIMVSQETGFSMFQNNELDWDGSPFSSLPLDALPSLKEKKELHTQSFLITSFLRMNVNKAPLHHTSFRKALALSLDRTSLIDHVLLGSSIYASGLVPASLGLKEREYFNDNDIEAVKCLLEDCKKEGLRYEDLEELTLSFLSNDKNYRICQTIQEQWRKNLGIKVRLEPIEPKLYFTRVSRKEYELCLSSWVADFRDPINFLEVFRTKDIGTNNTGWENAEYLVDLEKAYKTTDPDERRKILQECEKILVNEMPIIPLCHGTMNYVKKDNLINVILSDTGAIDFKRARLQH